MDADMGVEDVDVSSEVHGLPGPAIDVEAIERELSSLWKTPQVTNLSRHAIIPSRTSVLNLIVYAADAATAERAAKIVDHLSIHHPSRVIIFAVHGNASDFSSDIDASVAAHCHAAVSDNFATCFEQVTIATPPNALGHLTSLFLPLVLPDLPTYLWWPGQPPLGDPGLIRVARSTDRMIFDSLEFSQAAANLIRVADLAGQLGDGCTVCDLNWARLHHWRAMTAQFFDLPEYHWALDDVVRVSLRYGRARGAADNPAQALLFIGWAAGRLGWHLRATARRADGGWIFTADRPGGGGRDVVIELASETTPRRFNGSLLSTGLVANDGRRSGQFDAMRIDDLCTIRMRARAEGIPPAERAVRCAPREVPDLLVEELTMLSRDQPYEHALREARFYAEAMRSRSNRSNRSK